MIERNDSMLLYHGSYCAVRNPNLNKCSPYKDFGRGFYLTGSKHQAESFILSSVKKAMRLGIISENSGYGYVTTYKFCAVPSLKILEYEGADEQWLHCIAAHRKTDTFSDIREELAQYDVIAGKIANDQTNAALTAYLAELYGRVGTPEADNDCIRRLLPERLENQICLRSERALAMLTYAAEEKIWLNKH